MNRVAILSPSLTTGDAVSNDAFGMYHALRQQGYDARLYAETCSVEEPTVWPAFKIASFLEGPDDLLIYHYSRGWDYGIQLLHSLRAKSAIKYHNVTPPIYFGGFSLDDEKICAAGRKDLSRFAEADCDLYLSASEYNQRELLAAGVKPSKSFVVPPFHQIDRLYDCEPDFQIIDSFRDGKINILMVGRVSPHKGHVALLEAFAAYHHDYNSNSRLIIVGRESSHLHRYSALLREAIDCLSLTGAVVFTGGVSDAALKSYYLTAHLFATLSEHEGFCVPLVEAMALKVPVVAYASSAIPETVGEAGLVWKKPAPYLFAESINEIVTNEAVRSTLSVRGRRRYEQCFTDQRIGELFLQALSHLR